MGFFRDSLVMQGNPTTEAAAAPVAAASRNFRRPSRLVTMRCLLPSFALVSDEPDWTLPRTARYARERRSSSLDTHVMILPYGKIPLGAR